MNWSKPAVLATAAPNARFSNDTAHRGSQPPWRLVHVERPNCNNNHRTRTTIDLGATGIVFTSIGTGLPVEQISLGDGAAVSMTCRHSMDIELKTPNSTVSSDALIRTFRSQSCTDCPLNWNASVCDEEPRSTDPWGPNHSTSSRQKRLRESEGCALRNAIISLTKRKTSWCVLSRCQSSQDVSLSWL